MEPSSPNRSHAVVVGGGMAGLLAARTLADHFDRVTIVDRDRFPERPEFRKGVPQSRHVHVLLARGAALLEQQFPGISTELVESGAVVMRWPADAVVLGKIGWYRRHPRSLGLLSLTRHLLEWTVRRRVAVLPGVRFVEEHDAVGLFASPDGTRVRGLRLRSRAGADGPDRLEADLVVDASGRDSKAPDWLAEIGYERPRETKINGFLGYASRFYAIPPGFTEDWKAIYILGKPPDQPRGGLLLPVEGDRWLATVAGFGRDYPPTDEAGYLEFAGSLRSPLLYQAIRDAEPLGPVHGFQRTENLLRHFEELERWPEQFVVLGDAACHFNPVYGQGMTVAAMAAEVLDDGLSQQRRAHPDGDLTGFSHRFQRALAGSNGAAWLVSTGEDLRYPTTEGARLDMPTRLMHRYLDRVLDVATEDANVNFTFLKVLHMLVPPTALFDPRVLVPVLRGTRQPALTAPPPAPSTGRARENGRATIAAPSARDPEGIVHRWADLGDVRLHYVEAGQGPLVVLLHGFPEFWYSWRHQIRALAEAGFRVVAPDMRGFNLSDRPAGVGAYDVSFVARDVAGLIRACGAERAVVVGHDWGGAIAWNFAQRYPAMLERLAILNCPHPMRFMGALLTPAQLRKSSYMFVFQLPVIGEAWARYRFVGRALREDPVRADAFTPDDLQRYAAAADRPGRLTGGLNYYRALFRRNPLRTLREVRRIDAPVLVIWGDQDRYLGANLAEPDPRLVPNARVVHFPDASHWVQVDRPDRVNDLLLDFLADLRPATQTPTTAALSS